MLTNFNPYSVQFPMFQGPTPMQTPVPSQTYVQNIPSVNGIEEAKSLNIGKNATALILDANQNVLYVKSTDGIGAVSAFSAFEMKQIDFSNASDQKNDDRMTKIENDIAEIKKLLNERRGNNNGKQYSPNDNKSKPANNS